MYKKNFLRKINRIYIISGFLLLLTALILILIPVWPYIWYRIHPKETNNDERKIVKVITETQIEYKELTNRGVPKLDTSLPEGLFVIIPKVNIDSPISTSKNYKEGLDKGTWIVSNYGTPEKDDLPIILAAHRFGYASWSVEKRNKISYYNLPRTEDGDEVYIYWNQRKYNYRIYKSEESTYITDYSADLILYTCKFFNSPVRIFRYAERVN